MPQMMPIYWFFVCLMVNLFIYFFLSFHYFNFLVFSHSEKVCFKSVGKVSFISNK
uniref:ATP synthase F0 subunit 8 n=1 Tax=Campanulotes compar TaxID=135595 RepID=Q2HJL1_9NEOP|nr:ATP synthase F0 subunit 8 [Campanulotes compar]AAX53875.1 ATP synthase F0 subunit 8 [Campanulotes compar]AYD72935.1 ATP synthase F0 subunit 8 [Campanulotes compar]UTT72572.1 ATP synthase F0 subunit 8 [Campanulotes compar]